jgi:HSP20 family protein
MDLYDDEDSPKVYAMLELPGVERNTLTLRVQGTKLIVHGERGSPLLSKLQQSSNRDLSLAPAKYKVRELKFGSFRRELDIPASTDVGPDFAILSYS